MHLLVLVGWSRWDLCWASYIAIYTHIYYIPIRWFAGFFAPVPVQALAEHRQRSAKIVARDAAMHELSLRFSEQRARSAPHLGPFLLRRIPT